LSCNAGQKTGQSRIIGDDAAESRLIAIKSRQKIPVAAMPQKDEQFIAKRLDTSQKRILY
jgi:hypothetical protein